MTARLCLLIAALVAGPGFASAQAVEEDQAPAVATSRLAGLDVAGVRRQLGEPALARSEGAGGIWTYRPPSCVLFVYFADDGRGLRATGVSSGPRRHGDVEPPAEACLADAAAHRLGARVSATPGERLP